MFSRLLSACVLGVLLATAAASAATITVGRTRDDPSDQSVTIRLRGSIEVGDETRFKAALAEAKATGRELYGVFLSSPGGDVVTGIVLADIIRKAEIATIIPNGNTCASACFLAFAAGTTRHVRGGARLGVHGAAENGEETDFSTRATVVMARVAAGLGVPPAIIGRMVLTPPDQIVWLTRYEMMLMANTTVSPEPVVPYKH